MLLSFAICDSLPSKEKSDFTIPVALTFCNKPSAEYSFQLPVVLSCLPPVVEYDNTIIPGQFIFYWQPALKITGQSGNKQ
jgi:hypothetical protein